jgi:bifunctional UDP-N-acetylglucosamine pyrophosphorylase/glucosamine-1-phosphate N-acetyltransferase
MPLRILILAAGKGARMNSSHPKVVHPILNKPMINYVLQTVKDLNPQKTYVVVGYKK